MDTITIDKLKEYYEQLKEYSIEQKHDVLYNDSQLHAVMVFDALFQQAKRYSIPVIEMFCGSMAVFRDETRDIMKDYLAGQGVNKEDDFNPYKQLMESLQNYLDDSGKLSVVVEKPISSIRDEDCWNNYLKRYYHEGRLIIYQVSNGFFSEQKHFTVAGNAYRRERSHEDKTAFCSFNHPETASILRESFSVIQENAELIRF